MRELSTCDFCDAEAAGVYEVVPGDIPGVSSHRMVLCDSCRDTLSEIVDPLLDAGRRGARAKSKTVATQTEETAGGGTTDAPPESGPQTGPEEEPADTRKSGSASETEPEPGPDSKPEPGPESAPERSPEPESEPEPGRSSEPESEAGREPAPESGPGLDSTPEREPDSTPEREPDSTPERVERPEGYGKLVRLVENRDGGILRRDLEELASGAYGLNAAEVDDAIEFAIDHGTFEETDSGLKTT